MSFAPNTNTNNQKLIWYFILVWTILNAFQAATLEIHADEAYYWLYSRFLDWGYYDHPPMVAVFIKVGYSLFQNEFGARLVTVLTSSIAIGILWQTLKTYRVDAGLFITIVSSLLIFHIYGFITTPDAPLFFFTVIFYFLFEQYLKTDKWLTALLISITLACLLYSKYHGVLVILFSVLANVKLLKRPTFWLIVFLTTALYIPHIWWQIRHNYPSIEYHLFERTSEINGIENALLFPLGQLLIAGPLVGWMIFYYAFRTKIKDAFIRTLLVNAIGTLLFFWFSSAKGEVQPHWTLIAFVPITLLTLINFSQGGAPAKWFKILAYINIGVIVLFRIALSDQLPFIMQRTRLGSLFGYKEWTKQIQAKAGNAYVMFGDGFQDPAKYSFYTHSLKGFSYDSRYYRRTQFELWPIENDFQGKRTLYVATMQDPLFMRDTFTTVKRKYWYGWVDSTRTYQRVFIKTDNYKMTVKAGEQVTVPVTLNNPYPFQINFTNKGQPHQVIFGACFLQHEEMVYAQRADSTFYTKSIAPGKTITYNFTFAAPSIKGSYDLLFSLRTTPFPGGRNSRVIKFTVQ
ncbi:ArnT family glycosyltransferase [Mucilaginibacter ginkgonis]|uniref:Glycosyltransferase family 39 protein n=1 Tax=Mucilaginibacter ginkgonis TaxID=2682091 RepID=A0A6I4HVJ6_9SPHI|nr:glycosyltransferase family 39 protein [Mucilaginibacter ginkgonis]QQL49881.1 glycosyltransferase family 39 protein [Mucilaginibacter ginkgonis]